MIQIGDVLTLEPKYDDQFEKYKCRVVDKKGDDLFIDYPISLKTNRTVFLLDGSQMKATFVGQDGSSVFLFETEIKGRVKQNIPMLIIPYPGNENLIKIQRRQYVRVETAIDIALKPSKKTKFLPFTAVTEDVSAGGTSVLVPLDFHLSPGTILESWMVVTLQSGEYHYMKLESKVVRIIPFNQTRNKMSLEFCNISAQERQLLLRLCFDRQLGMKKKALAN
ncbi:flagellar brake domain-containing protein [Neobacillus sp. PS3-34]|uniref:flagellar brake protein n=1 Tax=Neobacillus sp. PS3-34 TaxID=3070678 RepID=UPI0027DFFDEC|nr:flagellar brake domain-containing protein [Neobacillus sp. PS3-34]WML47683.1 flagellar brake domain-containing protein [Neobacillus sp. PS3-34]